MNELCLLKSHYQSQPFSTKEDNLIDRIKSLVAQNYSLEKTVLESLGQMSSNMDLMLESVQEYIDITEGGVA